MHTLFSLEGFYKTKEEFKSINENWLGIKLIIKVGQAQWIPTLSESNLWIFSSAVYRRKVSDNWNPPQLHPVTNQSQEANQNKTSDWSKALLVSRRPAWRGSDSEWGVCRNRRHIIVCAPHLRSNLPVSEKRVYWAHARRARKAHTVQDTRLKFSSRHTTLWNTALKSLDAQRDSESKENFKQQSEDSLPKPEEENNDARGVDLVWMYFRTF